MAKTNETIAELQRILEEKEAELQRMYKNTQLHVSEFIKKLESAHSELLSNYNELLSKYNYEKQVSNDLKNQLDKLQEELEAQKRLVTTPSIFYSELKTENERLTKQVNTQKDTIKQLLDFSKMGKVFGMDLIIDKNVPEGQVVLKVHNETSPLKDMLDNAVMNSIWKSRYHQLETQNRNLDVLLTLARTEIQDLNIQLGSLKKELNSAQQMRRFGNIVEETLEYGVINYKRDNFKAIEGWLKNLNRNTHHIKIQSANCSRELAAYLLRDSAIPFRSSDTEFRIFEITFHVPSVA